MIFGLFCIILFTKYSTSPCEIYEGDVLLKSCIQKTDDVALIFTPIDDKYQDAFTHYAPSLGLVALENYLFAHGVTSVVLDGSVVYNTDEIINWLLKTKPKFVGQSVQLISYLNSLEIASAVHTYGGINVLGGHHATQMSDVILHNQNKLIDYVIVGDGEQAWYELIIGTQRRKISNLVFFEKNKVHHNDVLELDLDSLPPLDYGRTDLNPYKKRLHESDFSSNTYSNYLRVYSHKGCGNRLNGEGCVFCGRADCNVRFKRAERFWEDMHHCANIHHADYIFDVGDDFLFSHDYLNCLVDTKPMGLERFDFGIFGRANRVSNTVAKQLQKIGVSDVVIGFETGDEAVMKNCNKMFSSPEQNIQATDFLTSAGIDITASYVLGLPGETQSSLANTINNAKRVVDMISSRFGRQPKELVANLIEPSPGSPAFKNLVKAFPKRYYLKDNLDLEEMQRDYFRYYFGLNTLNEYNSFRKMLSNAAREIHSMVNFSDSQGWLNNELK